MFEAQLAQAATLKKIVEALATLVKDVNLECNEDGMSLQAMDSSHVSLCALALRLEAFQHFRCDKALALGLNLENLGKILRCSGNDDVLTLKSEDDTDSLSMMFENTSQDRISDFEMKLMQIDSESLGIPDTEYSANVTMSSTEFQRIIRDLSNMGDSCTIACNKEGIKFSVSGDVGTGNVTLRQSSSVDDESNNVTIDMKEPVELQFAMKYLTYFTKATALSRTVSLSISSEMPICVEYPIEGAGFIRYYLAPKIDDEEV
jgi:proliferating cell nuclear antigen